MGPPSSFFLFLPLAVLCQRLNVFGEVVLRAKRLINLVLFCVVVCSAIAPQTFHVIVSFPVETGTLARFVAQLARELPIHIYKNLIKGAYDRSEKYVKRPSTRKRKPKKYLIRSAFYTFLHFKRRFCLKCKLYFIEIIKE